MIMVGELYEACNAILMNDECCYLLKLGTYWNCPSCATAPAVVPWCLVVGLHDDTSQTGSPQYQSSRYLSCAGDCPLRYEHASDSLIPLSLLSSANCCVSDSFTAFSPASSISISFRAVDSSSSRVSACIRAHFSVSNARSSVSFLTIEINVRAHSNASFM